MTRSAMVVGLMMAGLMTASGCATHRDSIAKTVAGTRQDVFKETVGNEIQAGKAVAEIKFSVKSNYSIFMERVIKHSDPPYRLHVNIDGQTTTLEAEPVLEDKASDTTNDPELGKGWKYQFSKRILLAAGKHKVIVALPVDDVLMEQDLVLNEGTNLINLTPVYKEKTLRPYKGEHFSAGVKSVGIKVN